MSSLFSIENEYTSETYIAHDQVVSVGDYVPGADGAPGYVGIATIDGTSHQATIPAGMDVSEWLLRKGFEIR